LLTSKARFPFCPRPHLWPSCSATRPTTPRISVSSSKVGAPHPVIPNKANRKTIFPFDEDLYRLRNVIERTFCRLKDFRGIATRYDKLARNFLAAICLVAALCCWIN
jgi:hypothetical protein